MPPEPEPRRLADPRRYQREVMGTVASVRVHDDAPSLTVDRAVTDTFRELDRLEQIFSTFRRDSTISLINRGVLDVLDAGDEVLEVLDNCTWLEHESDGAFNARRPTDPTQIDPAGFVKGWAAERAAKRLLDAGLEHWWFSVGGDVLVHGAPATHRLWQIAVADPLHTGEIVGVFDVIEGAVATSGTSERGLHLWDGRRGAPAIELVAVTVIGPTLTWADALATAAFAMGHEGPTWVSRFEGYHALGIDPIGGLVHSDGLLLEPVLPGRP